MLPTTYHNNNPKAENTFPEGSASMTSPNAASPASTLNVDHIINRILLFNSLGGKPEEKTALISSKEVAVLCDLSRQVFLLQPSLLELSPADTGLTIIGDLHGHLKDLTAIFAKEGSPDIHNYLFLGNYVDSGRHPIELVCLLLCYKLKYPENFFLLRGAHESREMNKANGFWHKCRSIYAEEIWNAFNNCFDAMPFAAVLGDRIFCVHSGLSPDLQNLSQLRNIRRPTNIPTNGLLFDLLWATPTSSTPGWNFSDKGTSMVFGKGVCKKFAQINDLEFMIRGHATSAKGYVLSGDKKVLSLFSATNYEERVNDAAFAHIGVNLTIQVYNFDSSGVFHKQKLLDNHTPSESDGSD
ncbi:Serine/threonine-protein phosphatase PP1-beta [Hypsibius exemplaris]|uniref:protein-serine/threonine phosphatase n=1 Tax=Hypsibius exemplaris TaxID=2072580 RepID=A0A1W0WNP3_HYPEX|nr:Serine/threonine-protein phosphatase PP1-beta [Hypsibius exemplaris]